MWTYASIFYYPGGVGVLEQNGQNKKRRFTGRGAQEGWDTLSTAQNSICLNCFYYGCFLLYYQENNNNKAKKKVHTIIQNWTKGFNDPGNHDDVITHLEPDILECEVKQALESITMNKASGGDGIQYASKFGKLSSGHRTGKGQFSFQSQRRQCQRMLKLLHNCTHLAC